MGTFLFFGSPLKRLEKVARTKKRNVPISS